MTTATIQSTFRIIQKLDSNYEKIEWLYAKSRLLRSELDLANGRYTTHTSATSLIHELDS